MLSEFLAKMFTWTTSVLGSFGVFGLFILAIIESVFFPIPVEVLLLVLVALNPSTWLWLGIVAGVGSVIGAAIGYSLGYAGKVVLLERLFPKYVKRIHAIFNKYEHWAIFVGAFSPLPYKVFTIAAGAFYIRFWPFIFVSLLARTGRFVLIAGIAAWFIQQDIAFSGTLVEALIIFITLLVTEVYLVKKLWFSNKNT